jgi:hypothetical protein
VKVTDQRVGLMSEILNSIRLIKMYAWEDSFANKIAGKCGEHTEFDAMCISRVHRYFGPFGGMCFLCYWG